MYRPRDVLIGVVVVCALGPFGPGGCAARMKALRTELDETRETVARLERVRAADQARLAELSSALLLLKDQVETLVVASRIEGSAELPVVKLSPDRSAPPGPAAAAGMGWVELDTADPRGVVEAPGGVIDYSGPRPLLTDAPRRGSGAKGASGMAGTKYGKARPGAALALVAGDRLGVVPLDARPGRSPGTAAGLGSVPLELYRRSLELLRRRDYVPALRGFNEFVKRFPTHTHADNSLYWMGEIYYDRAAYLLAISEFARVVREYPTGNKAPAALLKMGYSYHRSGDRATARSLLEQVVRVYPGSDEARLAAKKLEEWK